MYYIHSYFYTHIYAIMMKKRPYLWKIGRLYRRAWREESEEENDVIIS